MRLDTIYTAVLTGDAAAAAAETRAALSVDIPPEDILFRACVPAMTEVGRQFEAGDRFVPEMLISARAMQAVVDVLKPLLEMAETKAAGKVVIGSVAGDLHDIGKNLVRMMLQGAGFNVIDLGTDVSSDQFVTAVQRHQPDILGMSALLTTTMASIKTTIEALTEAGLRRQVKVMIGGAPITRDFAEKVGADGFAADAGSVPRLAKALMGVA
ncbi:MAG: corrinoid protein [Anaerolineae bacterium]